MKNLIKKILKESEDDGFNWVDDVFESPDSILKSLRDNYGWSIYIPEVGKEISFYINPETWNVMSKVNVKDIGKRGHGSFGDNPHPKYQESPLESIQPRGPYYWGTEDFIDNQREGYKLYNVNNVAKDIVGFSEEAKQLTEEYQINIQRLTQEYIEKMKPLQNKYNFDNKHDYIEAVTVDNKGNIHRDR